MKTVEQYRRLVVEKEFAALRAKLEGCDLASLAEVWTEFQPLEKLVLFKLLAAPRAFEFYEIVDFDAKYFLLSAFDLNTIAPVLEGLPVETGALFRALPAAYYDRMLHTLACEQVEIEVSIRNN